MKLQQIRGFLSAQVRLQLHATHKNYKLFHISATHKNEITPPDPADFDGISSTNCTQTLNGYVTLLFYQGNNMLKRKKTGADEMKVLVN